MNQLTPPNNQGLPPVCHLVDLDLSEHEHDLHKHDLYEHDLHKHDLHEHDLHDLPVVRLHLEVSLYLAHRHDFAPLAPLARRLAPL
ncbi:hypothetical protein N7490_001188 [Penicillium lividum]|nr:hypothetical protein N7490_001188 [Penicillium lividum]